MFVLVHGSRAIILNAIKPLGNLSIVFKPTGEGRPGSPSIGQMIKGWASR